jgi:hypothetical protein
VDRRPSIIAAAAGIGAAVALVVIGHGGPPPSELQSVAAELDGRIRETTAAAHARAQTLAELPRLAWAVATDEQTMLDLTNEELAFQPQPDEVIEIAQVQRRDGAVTTLRRVGDGGSEHLPLADPGSRLLGVGGHLQVVDVVSVEPKTRADQIRGAVGVSRVVDTAMLAGRLRRARTALRVDLPGGGGVVIGHAPAEPHEVSLSLVADAAHGVKVTALAPTGLALGYLAGALAAFLAGLGMAAFLWRRATVLAMAGEAPMRELVSEVHIDLRGDRPRRG